MANLWYTGGMTKPAFKPKRILWMDLEMTGLEPERDVIVRLVGTSHGHGRPFFPLGKDFLVPDGEGVADPVVLAELYATGSGWSDIIDRTHVRFGVWGCAYLESILRSADGQVSREGS